MGIFPQDYEGNGAQTLSAPRHFEQKRLSRLSQLPQSGTASLVIVQVASLLQDTT